MNSKYDKTLKYRNDYLPENYNQQFTCWDCKQTKNRKNFPYRKQYAYNKEKRCKLCNYNATKKLRIQHSQGQIIQYLLTSAKGMAKKREKRNRKCLFKITEKDIKDLIKKQNNKCIYTGREFKWVYKDPNKPSIDRIDSSKGYIKENIQLVIFKANQAKSTMTNAEFISFINEIYYNVNPLKEINSIENKLMNTKQIDNKDDDNYLYIGKHKNPLNLIKIGTTNQPFNENNEYVYINTYHTVNAKIIYDFLENLLKSYQFDNTEWFNLTYEQTKHAVEGAIHMFDTLQINKNIDNLIKLFKHIKKLNIEEIASQNEETTTDKKVTINEEIASQTTTNKEVNTCLDCDEVIAKCSYRCRSCAAKESNKPRLKVKNRPSLEQLEEDLRTLPYTQVGVKYGVSDNSIRKWLKQYRQN